MAFRERISRPESTYCERDFDKGRALQSGQDVLVSNLTPLQRQESFLRSGFAYLLDGTLSPLKPGQNSATARKELTRRIKRAQYVMLQNSENEKVLVKGSDARRVLWPEECFQAVTDIHEGEGHYPGSAEKTRCKVQDRYYFPQLTDFVRGLVKVCPTCQFEKAGKAPRSDRDIHPTPPTAPFYRVHVDTAGPFDVSGEEGYRFVEIAVDQVGRTLAYGKERLCRNVPGLPSGSLTSTRFYL